MIFETIIVSDIDKLSSEKLFYYGIIFLPRSWFSCCRSFSKFDDDAAVADDNCGERNHELKVFQSIYDKNNFFSRHIAPEREHEQGDEHNYFL